MSRKRGLSPKEWEHKTKQFEEWLYKNGFEGRFEQLTQYQWRITISGKGYVDVYPGTQKYWILFSKTTQRYQNLQQLKKILL